MRTTDEPQRVLLLAAHLPDGGINTHMLTLGTALKRTGWEVAMCSGGPLVDGNPTAGNSGTGQRAFPPVAAHYEAAGIPHFDVSVPERPHRLRDLPTLLRLPLATWQVVRAVRRFRPSVLHVHTRQMGLYARIVQALMGIPFVSTMHNPVPPSGRLFAKTTFFGSAAIGVSVEIRDILINDYGVEPERARLVLPGIDADRFRPASPEERQEARDEFGVRPDQFALAFVGSIIPRKRPDILVAAVASLVSSGHDVVALMAGRGSEEAAVRAQAADQGVTEQMRLLGHQDGRKVMWASDALVLPSESEGFPLAVAEAMLTGIPALRTPSAGADQVEPDVTVLVFDYGDHEELARKVAGLIERPDFRETLVANALKDARDRFTSLTTAKTTGEIYFGAMNEHSTN